MKPFIKAFAYLLWVGLLLFPIGWSWDAFYYPEPNSPGFYLPREHPTSLVWICGVWILLWLIVTISTIFKEPESKLKG